MNVDYKHIEDLFTAILKKSKAIEGRFHVGHRYGLQEINYDQLGEALGKIQDPNKYPLVMMAPPHSQLQLGGKNDSWEELRIILFFAQTSFYNKKGVAQPNLKTRTSEKTILSDWDDMKRCAIDFTRMLYEYQTQQTPAYTIIPNNKMLFIPFSEIGADRVSGIRLDFDFKAYISCEVTDYDLPLNVEL